MFKNLLIQRNEMIKNNHWHSPREIHSIAYGNATFGGIVERDASLGGSNVNVDTIVSDLKSNLNEQMKYNEELEMKLYQSELDKKKMVRENLEQTKLDIMNTLNNNNNELSSDSLSDERECQPCEPKKVTSSKPKVIKVIKNATIKQPRITKPKTTN